MTAPQDDWYDPMLPPGLDTPEDRQAFYDIEYQATADTDGICGICRNDIFWSNGTWHLLYQYAIEADKHDHVHQPVRRPTDFAIDGGLTDQEKADFLRELNGE